MHTDIKRDIKIAPSILAADFAQLGAETQAICRAGCDLVHVDVMDGHFVPNITIGPAIVAAIKPHSSKPLDVHLMIAPVDPYIRAFAEAGADIISFHPEAGAHPHRTIQAIKSMGCKVGIVLNPATPISAIETLIDELDLILVMSVNPGFGGQTFIPSQLEKIARLRALIDASGRDIELEVDGGINRQTAPQVIAAGASILVAGTAVFTKAQAEKNTQANPTNIVDNYTANIKALRGA